MQPGYICVAGINVNTGEHIRPVLGGSRLKVALLRRDGGVFDIASMVDLGTTRDVGKPPEIEDRIFEAKNVRWLRDMSPDKFWKALKKASQKSLSDIFGGDLKQQGQGCAVDLDKGTASLGCLLPSKRPEIEVDAFEKIRIIVEDGTFRANLSVTDLRLFEKDHKSPQHELVEDIEKRIEKGTAVILSLGLARPWQKPGDTVRRHWLQVNNIHLEDDPAWQLG